MSDFLLNHHLSHDYTYIFIARIGTSSTRDNNSEFLQAALAGVKLLVYPF